ncbi:TetR-like C-terminal domain-containing protein [Paenibacillus phocaensis]|uniref:TetR-like C-terminal domain-containing protein n=1 Tax=Paenibacillus phocaensis TaxID=1776378 RepID=UPI000839B7B2|nr:TetR-like C-terminal domain-containing protein [Paenibacillus phocaensis]
MSYSQITKNALARSLKKLMLTVPLNKITIQQITADCGVTRHTFYNHFQDIYELLGWVYQTEVIEGLEPYRNYAGWKQGFLSVLRYTQKHKTMCLNTFHSLGREHLEKFLYDVIYGVAIEVVRELAQERDVSQRAEQEVADFYALAVRGQVVEWLKTGANTDPVAIADKVGTILGGNLTRSLDNYRHG